MRKCRRFINKENMAKIGYAFSLLLWVMFYVWIFLAFGSLAHGSQLTASWYDRASCIKESGQSKMANGKELNNEDFTAASWDYPFKTIIRVTNEKNGKSILVKISDRGPSKKLYHKGRVLDLSRRAFQSIADLREGVIPITFEVVK